MVPKIYRDLSALTFSKCSDFKQFYLVLINKMCTVSQISLKFVSKVLSPRF